MSIIWQISADNKVNVSIFWHATKMHEKECEHNLAKIMNDKCEHNLAERTNKKCEHNLAIIIGN